MVSAKWLCLAFASWVSATLFAQNPLLDASKLPDHLETPAATPSPQALSPERRGDILMARKMYREAAETYKQASLDSAIIENKIGIAYHQMLQTDIARKYYERAMKIDAAYAEATNNLGTIYYSRKSYRRAIKLYHRALKLSPDSASIYSNLGTAFFARKNYKQAAECYEKALSRGGAGQISLLPRQDLRQSRHE